LDFGSHHHFWDLGRGSLSSTTRSTAYRFELLPTGWLRGKEFLGFPLVFSFTGILIASLIVNLLFAIQSIQRAFEAINPENRKAAQVSGLSNW
jgi:ABC-type sulfate transport system permease component